MKSEKNRALLLFARTPVIGTVKKRLAQTIGNQSALQCYKLLLKNAITNCTKVVARRFLYFHPQKIETLPGSSQSLSSHFTLCDQKPDADLGEKMAAAFAETLQDDSCEQAVLIGSDIPFLKSKIIEQAFAKLADADIVLGPALDGGYYLIGLQRQALNRATIFQNIPWGTDKVFKTTVARTQAAGLSIATLPPLFDIDTQADLEKWQQLEKDLTVAKQLNEILQG